MPEIKEGTIINGCRIVSKLGEGGMGVVYKAVDEALDRAVAIKFLLPSMHGVTSRQRFLREAKAIAQCRHPGIIAIYSCGEFENQPYFIMEYVDGKPLDAFLQRARIISRGNIAELKEYGYLEATQDGDESLPYFLRTHAAPPLGDANYPALAAGLLADIADALFEAHSHGILHRDIKPANILLATDGAAKLADFGLAKRSGAASQVTAAHQLLGTLQYMSPEHFSKAELTPRTDIYSLGVVAYELFTLREPFPADDMPSFIKAVATGEFRPPQEFNPALPDSLAQVVSTCLQCDPKKRFSSARELSEALRAAAAHKGVKTAIIDGVRGLFSSQPQEASVFYASKLPPETRAHNDDRADAAALLLEARRNYYYDFDLSVALKKLNRALELDPLSADAHFMLCMVLHSSGDREGGLAAREKLQKVLPDMDERGCLKSAMTLAHHEDIPEKLDGAVEKYIRLYPHDCDGYIAASWVAYDTDNHNRCIELAGKVQELEPDSNIAMFIRVESYIQLGNAEKVDELLSSLLARYPDSMTIKGIAGNYYLQAGLLEKAQALLSKSWSLHGSSEELLWSYFQLQCALPDNTANAITAARRLIGALKVDSLKATVYYKLYFLYRAAGDQVMAAKSLQMARQLNPEKGYKDVIELWQAINALEAGPGSLTGIRPELMPAVLGCLKDGIFSAQREYRPWLSSLRYYEPRPSGDCACTAIWPVFRPLRCEKMFIGLRSVPLGPFTDSSGNILNADIEHLTNHSNSYRAEVHFAVKASEWIPDFVAAELAVAGQFSRAGDKNRFEIDDIPSRTARLVVYVLALPADSKPQITGEQPDKVLSLGGNRLLVYTRRVLANQLFKTTVEY